MQEKRRREKKLYNAEKLVGASFSFTPARVVLLADLEIFQESSRPLA